jgi:hypothetical protein
MVSYCVVVIEALSALNSLTVLSCRAFFAPALFIFLLITAVATPFNEILIQARQSIVLIGTIFLNLFAFLAAFLYKPNNWDSMTYHLPRIEHWLVQHNVSVYATNITRQNWMPPFGDYLSLVPRTVFGTDQFDALFSILSLFVVEIAILLILKQFCRSQIVRECCLALSLAPIVLLESTTTQVDLRATALVFAGIALFLSESSQFIFLPLLGITIGCGIKLTSLIPLLGIALMPTIRIRARAAFSAKFYLGFLAGVCTNLPWLLRNYSAFGSFSGPATVAKVNGFSIIKLALSPGLYIFRIVGLFYSNVGQPKLHTLNRWALHLSLDLGKIFKHLDFPHSKYWPDLHAAGFALNEDSAPNTVWVIFVVLITFYFLFRHNWIRLLIFSSPIILYCFFIEWQSWPNRIFISGFLFSYIFVACTFSDREVNTVKAYMKPAAIFSILLSSVFLLMSGDRGLIKAPFVKIPAATQYFNLQPQKYLGYSEIAAVIKAKGIKRVELHESENAWEYPLWAMNPDTEFSKNVKDPQMILCLDECTQVSSNLMKHESTFGTGIKAYF